MGVVRYRVAKFSDFQLLSRLKDLSWLSTTQLKKIADAMSARDVKHNSTIFEERDALSPDTHILLSGTAALSNLNGRHPQVVAILSPGVMFRIPLMSAEVGHSFRWTALNDCRVAKLPTERFISITLRTLAVDYARVAGAMDDRLGRLLARYPSFLGLRLRQRVAMALLELAREFGVPDARGMLIRIPLSQGQLAGLVGGSRPRVSHILIDLELHKIIVRERRSLAVVVRSLAAIVRSAAKTSNYDHLLRAVDGGAHE